MIFFKQYRPFNETKFSGLNESPMTEVGRIVDQLNRAFEGEAWHGPAVVEILEGITAQQAATRPLNGAHSIWEITLHIAAWERAVLLRLQGDRAEPKCLELGPPLLGGAAKEALGPNKGAD